MFGFGNKKKTVEEIEADRLKAQREKDKDTAKKIIKNWEKYLRLTNNEVKVKDKRCLPSYWNNLDGEEKVRWIVEFIDAQYIKDFEEWL